MKKTTILIVLVTLCAYSIQVSAQKSMKLSTSSKEAKELFLEARKQQDNSEFQKAQNGLLKAIELDREFAIAYALLGGKENIEKAFAMKDKVSEPERHYIEWRMAAFKLDPKRQGEVLRKWIEQYPNDFWPHYKLAQALATYPDKLNQAEEEFLKVIKINKKYGPVYNQLGYLYIKMEEPEAAEDAFRNYIKYEPYIANPYDSYGEFLVKYQRFEEAIEQFEKAMEVDPTWAQGLSKIGHALAFQEDYKQAREYHKKALNDEERPATKLTIYKWIAATYIAEKNIDKAITTFEEAAEYALKMGNHPGYVQTYPDRMLIMLITGNPDAGLRYADQYKNAIDINRDKLNYANNYDYYASVWLALVYAYQERFEEAHYMLQKAKKQMDKLANTAFNNLWWNTIAGYKEILAGNTQKAQDVFETNPNNTPMGNFGIAMAYDKNNNTNKAIEYYEKVLYGRYFDYVIALYRDQALARIKVLRE